MNEGLFQYCRHPNYFGEILVWTSLTTLAGTGGVLSSHPWILASPLFTAFLLIFVSGTLARWTCAMDALCRQTYAPVGDAGIPPLEESHEKRYGKEAAYKEYKANTSLLIPWPKAEKPAAR